MRGRFFQSSSALSVCRVPPCAPTTISVGRRSAMIDGNIVTGRIVDVGPEFIDAITDALCGTHLLEAATPTPQAVASTAS